MLLEAIIGLSPLVLLFIGVWIYVQVVTMTFPKLPRPMFQEFRVAWRRAWLANRPAPPAPPNPEPPHQGPYR